MPNNPKELPLDLNAMMLLVLTALLSSHAMDVGQLLIVAWDTLVQGAPGQKKYRIEGGLLVAGVGLVVLTVIGARNAVSGGTTKDTNTVLASFATGLLGLSFSILDKTAGDNGVPTPDTARGLIFVVVGGCILLPPYLAMPSTPVGFRKATGTLARVGTAGIVALLLGLLVQAVYSVIAFACVDPCGGLTAGQLSLGGTPFFISAPSAGAFAAGMAVLATDPTLQKAQWDHFGIRSRALWLFGMLLVAAALSALYALGSYYPDHGEVLTESGPESGWMRKVPGAELDRLDAVTMLALVQLPALLAAVVALVISPAWPRSAGVMVRDTALLVGAAIIGGIGASAVTALVDGTGQLQGKEIYFVAAHGATAVAVVIAAWASRGLGLPTVAATNRAVSHKPHEAAMIEPVAGQPALDGTETTSSRTANKTRSGHEQQE